MYSFFTSLQAEVSPQYFNNELFAVKDGYADDTDGADERGFYFLLFRLAEFWGLKFHLKQIGMNGLW